jgi:hypothetical protein
VPFGALDRGRGRSVVAAGVGRLPAGKAVVTLERLRAASDKPVALAQLRAGGIDCQPSSPPTSSDRYTTTYDLTSVFETAATSKRKRRVRAVGLLLVVQSRSVSRACPFSEAAPASWEQSPQRLVATAPFSPNRKRSTAAPWRLLCTTSSDVHDRDHVIAIVARRASRSPAGCACRWAIASVQPRRAAG